MFDVPPAIIKFMAQKEYEVTFIIKKPYARTSEVVKSNSSVSARNIIEAQYGKDKITIISVKEVKQ